MKDEFKSVVPSAVTSSRRATPQQHQQLQQQTSRRPSDGTAASNGPRGSGNGPHAQPSPRVKAHLIKGSFENATAAATSPPQFPTTRSANDDSEASGVTFITALLATKQRPKRHGDSQQLTPSGELMLRPPSPLESADVERRPAGSASVSSSEPVVANYVGVEALRSFWHMFHREEEIHNRTLTANPRPASPATPSTPNSKPRHRKTCTNPPSASLPLLVLPVTDRPRSARSTYLAAVRKLHISPEPMGIVRRRAPDKGASSSVGATTSSALSCSSGGSSSTQEINLSSYRMGDVYATAFSESFSLVPGVESINLTNNRIGDAVAARVVRNALQSPVAATLQTLNLSHNALGGSAASALAELLKSSKTLTSLNVAHNQLKDRDIAVLCDALQKNQTLARVHLSENKFGTPGMVAIAKFLEENAKIEEVYLAWNNIRGLGALKIAEALKFHASLRALDLSWNAFDSNDLLKPRAIITALADAVANNKVLTHLDLSNNHLDVDDCAILAKQLEANHTLIGLHMSGNCGAMDTRGFLIAKQPDGKLLDQHKMYSIAVFEEAMSDSGSGTFPTHVTQLVDKFCWYCGQWSEHRFVWTPPPPSPEQNLNVAAGAQVHLHLSHDDWRGVDMEKRGDGSYSAYSILPPGKTEYFFTVSQKSSSTTNASDPPLVTYHYIKEKRHERLLYPHKPELFGSLDYVNVLRTARRDSRDPCNTLQPRSNAKSTGRPAKWDINRSVFSRRRRESVQRSFVDTDAFIQKACVADWKQCKIDRFVKDPARRKEVELCVTRHYRTVANVYRKYCGHNVLTSVAVVASVTAAGAMQIQNELISVPWSGYMEFLTECKILDENSEYCRYADLENVFVAANLELTAEAKEKDNPDRSLTRFEFMEVVIRIAMNKYHRTNVCDTPAKAVDKLIADHLVPIAPDDPNDFRTRFLYTEEVSDVFSEHVVLLQDIYNSNMGRYCKPGEKKGMQLVEFLSVMEKYQVYSDSFKIRDVKEPFLACKLVVLDEMATVGHKKLFLTDFMELLLRVAVLRYPARPMGVFEVTKSLQKLFVNHFLKHEDLLDAFRGTVDQVVVQQRIEAFAGAINASAQQGLGKKNKKTHKNKNKNVTASATSMRIDEEDEEDDDEDDEEDEEEDEGERSSTSRGGRPTQPTSSGSSMESKPENGSSIEPPLPCVVVVDNEPTPPPLESQA